MFTEQDLQLIRMIATSIARQEIIAREADLAAEKAERDAEQVRLQQEQYDDLRHPVAVEGD